MAEKRCFRCGATDVPLYDAISKEGIVKICEKCLFQESMPLISRKREEEPGKRQTVYERLSAMSGISPKDRINSPELEEQKKKDEEAKLILERKYREDLARSDARQDLAGNSNLVRNFHWEIVKARRAKRLTQKQLADMIDEPEVAIRMAERGILPRERERLVKKIETFLRIKITNTQAAREITQIQTTVIPEGAEAKEEDKPKKKRRSFWSLLGFEVNEVRGEDLSKEETPEKGEKAEKE